jgi:hypothetical protein
MSQSLTALAAKSIGSRFKAQQQSSEFSVPVTSVHRIKADGVHVFYRAAGDPNSGSAVVTWVPNIILHVPRTHPPSRPQLS